MKKRTRKGSWALKEYYEDIAKRASERTNNFFNRKRIERVIERLDANNTEPGIKTLVLVAGNRETN